MKKKIKASIGTKSPLEAKKYELMVIIQPDIGTDRIKKRLAEIQKMITSGQGEVFFEDVWGLRDLAYEIRKYDKGYYVVLGFTITSDAIAEMNNTLKLENEVLRHMIVTLPFKYEPKSLAQLMEVTEAPLKTDVVKDKPAPKSVEKKAAPKVKATPVKEVAEVNSEEKEKKAPAKAKKEPTLEEVDAKLKSIIDNPDLNF